MKHLIKTIITSIILLCANEIMAQASERFMSIEELFTLADANNKIIKIYEYAVTGAEQNISIAKNTLLPDIVFSASASYNGDAWVSDRDFSNGQTFSSPHFGDNFSIEASQVVFAGGAIYNEIKALEIGKEIAEWDLKEHRQEVYFLLTGYFLDLYKYRNLLTVYDRNMEQTMQIIHDMKARESVGIVLNNDITRYEVQYQNLKYKRTELLSSIKIYNDKIVTLLELPPQTEIFPDSTLLKNRMEKHEESGFQNIASKNSPLLNKNRLAIDMLYRKEKTVKAGIMPHLNLMAGDNLKGPITYEIPVLDNNINTWYVGMGLTFSIGNLYKTPKELSYLRTSIEQANFELSLSENNISHNVRAAYIHYLDSFELLKTQEKSLQLAIENYEITSNRYSNDLVLVTDLVDADNLKIAAEVQLVNAQINVIYSYYKLLYETGTLNSINN